VVKYIDHSDCECELIDFAPAIIKFTLKVAYMRLVVENMTELKHHNFAEEALALLLFGTFGSFP
jgi:hypothetical protein